MGRESTNRTAVVTGGSSGIGLAVTERLLADGWTVYNLSRHPGGNAIHIPTDVSDEQAVRAAFERVDREAGGLSLLVNCAGFGISGAAEETALSQAKRQFDVNFFGTLLCSQQAAGLMRRDGGGRIINVSSAAAIFAIPFQAFYSASKSAINSLSLAMDNELRGFGIRVTAVMPGDVLTGFTDAREKNAADGVYGDMVAKSVAVMEKDERGGMTPEYIAECIVKTAARRSPKPLYVAGAQYKLFALLFKLLPIRTINWLVGKLYIKK